jgi:hypothetical protein
VSAVPARAGCEDDNTQEGSMKSHGISGRRSRWLAVVLAALAASGAAADAPPPGPTGCVDGTEDQDKPHLLAAAYYGLRDGMSAKLMLNNKGPQPLEVQPALYSMGGERYDVGTLVVEGNSFRTIDLREWVRTAGPRFREGSVQVFHLGPDLVLGAQVYLVDGPRRLSFEEKLVEHALLPSSGLRGVWWLPSTRGKVLLALSNTSDATVRVRARAEGTKPSRRGRITVELGPHQTRLLDVERDLLGRTRPPIPRMGAISVEHDGPNGAVLARGFAQEAARGYSLAVQFAVPQGARSSGYQGVGLRLRMADGTRLTPVAVAHNAGPSEATVTGRLNYTSAKGLPVEATLPEVRLAPGRSAAIDVAAALRGGDPPGTGGAGLEFEYTTEPGSVQMTAFSIGGGGDQLFRVPLWDVAAQRSATGGYPWSIDGSSTTLIHLKNVMDEPQQYTLWLGYDGGAYRIGVRTLGPRQTVTFDVRSLRDEQVRDDDGAVIPPGATRGQVIWSIYGPDALAMIGRSEQVDEANAVSSSYACQNCCADSFLEGRVETDGFTVDIGGSTTFLARERRSTCYGQQPGWFTVFPSSWSSWDPGIAWMSGGHATGMAFGSTNVEAFWTGYARYPYIGGTCQSVSFPVRPNGPVLVAALPRVVSISQRIIDESTQGSEVVECGQFEVKSKLEVGCPFAEDQRHTYVLTGNIQIDADLVSDNTSEIANDQEKCTYENVKIYRMKNRFAEPPGDRTGFTSYRGVVTWLGRTASKAGAGFSTRSHVPGNRPCP